MESLFAACRQKSRIEHVKAEDGWNARGFSQTQYRVKAAKFPQTKWTGPLIANPDCKP